MIYRIDDPGVLVGYFTGMGSVFAPVRTPGDRLVWREVSDGDSIDLSARTDVSARCVFQPATSYFLRFGHSPGAEPQYSGLDRGKRTVIGLRPCDVTSLGVFDRVFAESGEYGELRERTLLVGLLCDSREPSCFCEAVGGSPGDRSGMDLVLYRTPGGSLLLETVTRRGEEALEGSGLQESEEPSEPDLTGPGEVTRLPADVAASAGRADHRLWAEVAFPCVNCRVCTYVCPTCHCFTVTDENFGNSGARAAVWDSCQSREFTLEASGHNPRESGAARARQRIMHKFSWYPSVSDAELMCSGCGRCISGCPTGRSIVEDLYTIAGEV
jgi:ferredoxin